KPLTPGPHSFPFAPRHVLHNKTQGRLPVSRNIASKTTLAPTTTTRQESLSTPGPTLPVVTKQPIDNPGGEDLFRSVLPPFLEVPLAPKLLPPPNITPTMASEPMPQINVERHKGHPLSQPEQKPFTQPLPNSQLQPQYRPPPPPQPKPKSQRKAQPQPKPNSQTQLQSQPPPTCQSKPKNQPQPEPTSKPILQTQPQPQPQPTSQLTRTYSDPTKVTPRQAVPTAPSPPEEGKPLPRPALATDKAGTSVTRSSIAAVPRSPISSSVPPAGRNTTLPRTRVPTHSSRTVVRPISPSKTFTSSHSSSTTGAADGAHHRGNALPKPVVWPKENPVLHPPIPVNKRPNLVGKPSDHDKPMDLKQGDKESFLKLFPLVTPKPKPKQEQKQQTTTSAPAVNSSRFDMNENSSIFRPLPASEVDIMGKKRFVAPHVIYKTDKPPHEPCSITSSLAYFPDEEGSDQNVTGPPRIPPSNLTVVTVEGCPSFVILDWQKSDNETREYEVVSTTKGPNGEEVSILTTNQTHTAVENLQPESSYEFKVTPKNELGTGPSSDPVTFSTESADPRVSEHVSGKDAIWTQFPFKSDAYSECSGKQYVKRTWYRKFVGIQLCNSLRYKIYLSDSLNGKFYNIGDQTGHGEDHCQFVDSFLDGRTGTQMFADQLPSRPGFYRAMRQEPVSFGEIGGKSHVTYVGWYECGTPIPGK
ncbi:target of Nesh-SH3-like protein, partial [Lates japonicus]